MEMYTPFIEKAASLYIGISILFHGILTILKGLPKGFFFFLEPTEALAFFLCSDSSKEHNSTCRTNNSTNDDNGDDNYSSCHGSPYNNGSWYLPCAYSVLAGVLSTLLLQVFVKTTLRRRCYYPH